MATHCYSQDGITIYHGDARGVLPSLPGGLIVTDPPYNRDYHYDLYADSLTEANYDLLLDASLPPPAVVIHYPEELIRLAVRWRRTPERFAAWVYHANTPHQWRGVAWWGIAPDFRLGGQAYKNPRDQRVQRLMARGSEAMLYDWWHVEQIKNVSREKTEHPCQVPLRVMENILRITPFAGPVIDPFMGSGTTLLAAKRQGREAVGIEVSEKYIEIAIARLSSYGQEGHQAIARGQGALLFDQNQAPSPSSTGEGGVVSEKGEAAEGVTTGTVE